MAKMQGTIEKFRKDRKAFAIDDVWYSAFKAAWMGEAQSGDTVEFEYTEKGDFKNITQDTLKVIDKKPAGSSGGGGGYKGGNSNSKGEFRSVPQLVRNDALYKAVQLIGNQGFVFASPKAAMKASLYIANVYAAYVDGEISLDGVDCPAPVGQKAEPAPAAKSQVKHTPVADPAPEQKPEPQPEETPASPAPSLDAFLDD